MELHALLLMWPAVRSSVRSLLWPLAVSVALAGCASDAQRIDQAAKAAGLSRSIANGANYRHVVYSNALARSIVGAPSHLPLSHEEEESSRGNRGPGTQLSRPLFVFLDGDGRPWSANGQQPRADPTTHNPLALKMLMQTPAAGIYVSRPCYQQVIDADCSSKSWTSGRYASGIVTSIATTIRDTAAGSGFQQVVIVGYSGGGALAVLVAERLENVAAVFTIAANLDTDAWTTYHHYLPLSASLNPATSTHAHPWREVHLTGMQDTVVPATTTAAYFAKFPDARQWPYADFDHVCCWAEQWPTVFGRIEEELGVTE